MDPRYFPTFDELPTDNAVFSAAADRIFYDNEVYDPVQNYCLPSRHWCLLAEITDMTHSTLPLYGVKVKDKSDKEFLLTLKMEDHDEEQREEIAREILSCMEVGRTIAILYADRHRFSEELQSILPVLSMLESEGEEGIQARSDEIIEVRYMPFTMAWLTC
ncbi:hypothetical protein GQ44DRAFT_707958 [Phaeosphaeriaceae sp. PMI808]|nr:hypothetical protein GQ44DRAFT_707958 [Phaeosphaeriaceae sp. PMI808]